MSKPSPKAAGSAVAHAVLELGKKLVAELGIDDSVDTLGRWMAHYVSQLIEDANSAKPDQRAAVEDRCAAAILELWRHRHALHQGREAFEPEPLLRAIASLDPDSPHPRYFRSLRKQAEGDGKKGAEWLRLADGIDDTARMLLVQCLGAAASQAGDKSQEWIAMAEAAAFEDDAPSVAIRFVNEQQDFLDEAGPRGAVREKLAHRLERLRVFAELAKMLENQLAQQLGAISKSAKRSAKSIRVAKRAKQSLPRRMEERQSPQKAKKRGNNSKKRPSKT